MLKSTCMILSATLPLLAAADEANNSEQSCCCPLLPPAPVESCQLPAGLFVPAQYAVRNCGYEYRVAGEFLYWELNEDSLEQIASEFDGTFAGGPGTLTTITSLSHNIGYKPGFKVGVGIGLPCYDQWELNVEYTWYQHETTKRFTATGQGNVIVSKFIPVTYFVASTALKSDWTMNLNFIHGTMGRAFYLSQRFIVNAGAGLKAWWAKEKHDLYFTTVNGDLGTQFTTTGFWGIGPYVDAKIRALLWCGIYLQGKAGVWTVYTRLNKYRATTNFPAVAGFGFPGFNDVETQNKDLWLVRLFYEGGVALGWGTYFCDCGYHIDLSVGYDMMTNYVGMYALVVSNYNKAFYYQGLSVRAQLDF